MQEERGRRQEAGGRRRRRWRGHTVGGRLNIHSTL